jgi:hypothetical protein
MILSNIGIKKFKMENESENTKCHIPNPPKHGWPWEKWSMD